MLLNAAKRLKIWSIMNFKISKFTCILSISQPAFHKTQLCYIHKYIASDILHHKGNHIGFMKLLFWWMFIHCAMVFPFYTLLLSFSRQSTYGKVKNLQIDVDMLVGKVLINLLCHTKSVTCIINIIIDEPAAAAYSHS